MKRIAVKDGLFTLPADAQQARLLGGHCPTCKRFHFPAQAYCPYCCSDGCETRELDPEGTIEVCTTVLNRPPGYEGPLPFGFGVVQLAEGIRLISRVLDPEKIEPGARVRFTLETIGSDAEGRDIVTYAFSPRDLTP